MTGKIPESMSKSGKDERWMVGVHCRQPHEPRKIALPVRIHASTEEGMF
jgi:hypothetical protein